MDKTLTHEPLQLRSTHATLSNKIFTIQKQDNKKILRLGFQSIRTGSNMFTKVPWSSILISLLIGSFSYYLDNK